MELSEDHKEVMHRKRPFDTDNDRSILNEWAEFLKHVSDMLVDLTLEDRYLVSEGVMDPSDTINPAEGEEGDPEDWGGASK